MRTFFRGLLPGLLPGLLSPLPAQEPTRPVQTDQPILSGAALDGEVHGLASDRLPGGLAGMERWIVHFKTRTFDLRRFRAAVHGGRPADEVARIVEDLEEDVVADQAAFVQGIEEVLGGRVFAQWWLINACAIEIPFKDLDKVRALPNVDRLEPDRLWHPWIKTSTNSSNHNSDLVQTVLKVDGSGVTVAILDTGQNSDVGSGRPHRTYFPNGNPSNTSGAGIGGSRLVVNRQIGRLTANDVVGHGTGVGSVAAGANWGTSGADHGHAFGANIAGYAIGDTSSGSSTSSTMVSAWQAAASDRAKHNIVAANLSFGGSPNPTESAQMALDSAALNADILPCVAAGNSRTSTAGSQGAANGLAVGAISANNHTVASFSSRGPLSGTQRFYPDIAALGVNTVMARTRNEGSDLTGSGTSMASPQVCGVAGLVRAANSKLTALQTKAILLATTQNIQQANPTLDRNSFGTGMLRADLAVTLALSKSGFGAGTLTSSTRIQKIPLSVVQGKQYAVVVTWHRTVLSSSSYSNLDLRVLDGSSLLAESRTPANLYENATFLARKTGTFTLEVSSPTLVGSSQTFAYAFTEAPKAPIPGVVSSFGQGCKGNGIPVGGTCMSDNTTRSFRTSTTGYPGVTYALEVVATSNLTVEGWEMMSASGLTTAQTVSTLLYDANSSGQPNNVLATGTMQIGPNVGWYKSTFSKKVQISNNQRFFLAFVNASPFTTRLGITTSGNITPYWRNNGPSGAWIRFTTRPWAWKVTCAAATGGAVPEAGASGEPTIGGPLTLTLRRALANANSFLVVGLSKTRGFGTTLPFNLAALGAPSCSLYVSGEAMVPARADAVGSADLKVAVPNDKTLIGASAFTQFAVQDQKANTLGYAFTNALTLVAGGTP